MKKMEITGINYEVLEELDLALKKGADIFKNAPSQSQVVTNATKKDFINREINSWIEASKADIYLTPTIRELDIQELKKLDAVLYRDEQIQTPSSIKASDLSEKAVNLYAAMVSRVYKMTVKSCEEAYSSEDLERLSQGYKDFAQETLQANGNKSKKFDAARNAMALLRSSASGKNLTQEPVLKK